MKHIKKFNERLRSSTYIKAAKALGNMGHTRRASELEEWSKELQKRKDRQDELENYNRLSKYPSFKVKIVNDKFDINSKSWIRGNEPILEGNFFISVDFESDMFNDQYSEWVDNESNELGVNFFIGIHPADEESSENLKNSESRLSEEIYSGTYYTTWLYFRIDGDKITNSWGSRDVLLFSDRGEANKFRRLISDALSCKNKLGESKWSKNGIGDELRKLFMRSEEEQVKDFCWLRGNESDEEKAIKINKTKEELEGKFLTKDMYYNLLNYTSHMSINQLYRN